MKKIRLLYTKWTLVYPLLLLLLITSCNKSDFIGPLSLSVEEVNDVKIAGDQIKVMVSSKETWTATTNDNWISINVNSGLTRTVVTLTVMPNFTTSTRRGTVVFKTETESKTITINQLAGDIDPTNIQYEIPVIFHVMYNNDFVPDYKVGGDTINPQVPAQRIQQIIEKVNLIYRGIPMGVPAQAEPLPNIKVSFVLAKEDPNGKTLRESGVNRIEIPESRLDYRKVMDDSKGGKYHNLSWPLDKYINIYLFKFAPNKSNNDGRNGIVLGAAHMPYTTKDEPIEGIQVFNPEVLNRSNHCIVINTDAIYSNRWNITDPSTRLIQTDAASTIAHELGHYLGLFHTFAENRQRNTPTLTDECIDSDYCQDTPSYNRQAYLKPITDRYGKGNNNEPIRINITEIAALFNRTSCTGERFVSDNVMDYEFTDSYRFTNDQLERMRKVLYFSPIVPGHKPFGKTPLRSYDNIPVPTPQVMICQTSLPYLYPIVTP